MDHSNDFILEYTQDQTKPFGVKIGDEIYLAELHKVKPCFNFIAEVDKAIKNKFTNEDTIFGCLAIAFPQRTKEDWENLDDLAFLIDLIGKAYAYATAVASGGTRGLENFQMGQALSKPTEKTAH